MGGIEGTCKKPPVGSFNIVKTLQTTAANCITIGEKYIFVGCAEGIIRCFDPNLRFITTLPRTHYLGVDVSLGTNITYDSVL